MISSPTKPRLYCGRLSTGCPAWVVKDAPWISHGLSLARLKMPATRRGSRSPSYRMAGFSLWRTQFAAFVCHLDETLGSIQLYQVLRPQSAGRILYSRSADWTPCQTPGQGRQQNRKLTSTSSKLHGTLPKRSVRCRRAGLSPASDLRRGAD